MQAKYSPIAREICEFKGGPTRSRRTAGEAEEGKEFENRVKEGFFHFFNLLIRDDSSLSLNRLEYDSDLFIIIINKKTHRAVIFGPVPRQSKEITRVTPIKLDMRDYRALSYTYRDEHIFERRLEHLLRNGYLPKDMSTWDYNSLFRGSKTKFDGVMLLMYDVKYKTNVEVDGLVKKKILLECKYAKSSNGIRIDGNAHERFSFQMLQYLLISEMESNTHLLCLTNSSYLKHKNKYHVGFSTHALILSEKFDRFKFSIISSEQQYVDLFDEIHKYLLNKSYNSNFLAL